MACRVKVTVREPRASACDIMGFVRNSENSTLILLRWGGTAAIFGGLSYGAAGYLDEPGISGYLRMLVSALSVATPALFLGGLMGLRPRLPLGRKLRLVSETGFVVGCLGTVLGTIVSFVGAVGSEQAFWWQWSMRKWWWVPLFVGLTLMGLAMLLKDKQRRLGALVITSGMLGWGSLLTDPAFPGVLVPMRPVHVAFAALFCLGSIVWGLMLIEEVP